MIIIFHFILNAFYLLVSLLGTLIKHIKFHCKLSFTINLNKLFKPITRFISKFEKKNQ